MSSIGIPVNAFDVLFLCILVGGVICGRKRGMSEELLGLLKWISVVVGCSLLYQPVGTAIASTNTLFSLLSCYLLAYSGCALAILALFALLKRSLGGKLLGSDIFGRAEYYLGMGSGLVRFFCILIAGLALLNARAYDVAEVKAMENFQNKEFGSNYFPTLHSIQSTVFDTSVTGPFIRDNLGFLLISRTRPQPKQLKQQEYVMPY